MTGPVVTTTRGADLHTRLDQLDLAVTGGAGQLNVDTAAAGRRLLRRVHERLRLSGDHTVVALAGGTGSGKSSLFNALAGLELSGTGIRRPTTQAPYACIWGTDPAPELLDWLDVPAANRIAHRSVLDPDTETPLRGLVLLDLPDHDSVQAAHRLEVERLIGLVDMLVWVLDPQKYADDTVHEQYLQPLAGHVEVMVVVLNQVDRLADEEAAVCEQDLRRMLAEDGLAGVRVLCTSALIGTGVDALHGVLAAAVASKSAAVSRVAADLGALAGLLRGAARPVLDPAVVHALSGPTAARVADLLQIQSVLAAVQTRQVVAGRLVRRGAVPPEPDVPVPTAAVTQLARDTAATVGDGLPQPWAAALQHRAEAAGVVLAEAAAQAVVRAVAEPPSRPTWWRVMPFLLSGLVLVAVCGLLLAFRGAGLLGTLIAAAAPLIAGAAAHWRQRAVVATATTRREHLASRLQTELAALVESQLITPLRDEVSRYNAVQRALHDLGSAESG